MLSGRVAGLTIILGLHASSSRDTFGLSLEDRQANREDSHFATVRARGKELLAKGDTRGAQSLYEATVKQAAAMSDWAAASRFVNNIAGCQMARFEYREAVNSFLESRRMALQARDTEVVFATSMNLSAIYLQLGDVKLAAEAVARGLAADAGQPRPELRRNEGTESSMVAAHNTRVERKLG